MNIRAGPCLTTAIWRCRNSFSQWQRSFQRNMRFHWLKFLRQRHVAVVRRGPGPNQGHCVPLQSVTLSSQLNYILKSRIFEINFVLIIIKSGHNVAQVIMAQPAWHIRNVWLIWSLYFMLNQNGFSKEWDYGFMRRLPNDSTYHNSIHLVCHRRFPHWLRRC